MLLGWWSISGNSQKSQAKTQAFSRKVDYAMGFIGRPSFLCFSYTGLDFVDPYIYYRSRTFQEQLREFRESVSGSSGSLNTLAGWDTSGKMQGGRLTMKSQKLTEGCRSRGSPVPRTTFYEQRSHHRAKTLLSQSQGGSSGALYDCLFSLKWHGNSGPIPAHSPDTRCGPEQHFLSLHPYSEGCKGPFPKSTHPNTVVSFWKGLL